MAGALVLLIASATSSSALVIARQPPSLATPSLATLATPAPARTASDDEPYAERSTEREIVVAAARLAAVRGTSDIISQHIQRCHASSDGLAHIDVAAVDVTHVAAMCIAGLLISGTGGAMWLMCLERALGPTTSWRSAVHKAGLDYVCWAPAAISCNLVTVSLLTGHGCQASLQSVAAALPTLMALEWKIFAPYNLVGYSYVPPAHRVAAKAVFSFFFSIALSGYC